MIVSTDLLHIRNENNASYTPSDGNVLLPLDYCPLWAYLLPQQSRVSDLLGGSFSAWDGGSPRPRGSFWSLQRKAKVSWVAASFPKREGPV